MIVYFVAFLAILLSIFLRKGRRKDYVFAPVFSFKVDTKYEPVRMNFEYSEQVSVSVSMFLRLFSRDFLLPYCTPTSMNYVESVVSSIVSNLASRIANIPHSFVVEKIVPLLNTHLKKNDDFHPACTNPQQHLRRKLSPILKQLFSKTIQSAGAFEFIETICVDKLSQVLSSLSDPHFWNTQLEYWAGMAIRELRIVNKFRRTLKRQAEEAFSVTQEDLIKSVKSCKTLTEADKIRNQLIQEIKKQRKQSLNDDIVNGLSLQERMKYATKLVNAKTKIESKITALGGPSYSSTKQTTLSFVISNPQKLMQFMQFMESQNKDHLLSFYLDAKKFNECTNDEEKANLYIELQNSYFTDCERLVLLPLELSLKFHEDSYDAVLEAQHHVFRIMERDFESFLCDASDDEETSAVKMIKEIDLLPSGVVEKIEAELQSILEDTDDDEVHESIDTEIHNEIDRLTQQEAIIDSLLQKKINDESVKLLKKSKSTIRDEMRELLWQETQLEQRSITTECSVDVVANTMGTDGVKEFALYTIEVRHRKSLNPTWIVSRRYSEFLTLHQTLRRKFPQQMQGCELPKKFEIFSKRNFVENRQTKLSLYLQKIQKIPEISHTEEFRRFVCVEKLNYEKPKFFNFKRKKTSERVSDIICDLFVEIFELQNWFRRNAVKLILQQVFGQTIERKVQECMNYLTCPELVSFYIDYYRELLWPNDVFDETIIEISDAEKKSTRSSAYAKMSALVLEILGTFVGKTNAQNGCQKVFQTIQNPVLNTHLMYTILDLILDQIN